MSNAAQRIKARAEEHKGTSKTPAQTKKPEPSDTAPLCRIEYEPFPVDTLTEPLRSYVTAGAESLDCDPVFIAVPMLGATASAVGLTRVLELKSGWRVPPILWTIVVAESGSMKTPGFRTAMKPFQECDTAAHTANQLAEEEYRRELEVWEKDYALWKKSKGSSEPPEKPKEPPAKRLIVNDTTVEALAPILRNNPRGVLLAMDELSGWFGSFDRYSGKGNADRPKWLSMFNAEAITVDRKTGTPRTIHVPRAAVSVCGTIQPDIFNAAMNSQDRESGLLARLLIAMPPRKTKTWTEAVIPPTISQQVSKVVRRLYDLTGEVDEFGGMKPYVVKLSPEAKTIWLKWFEEHNAEAQGLTGDDAAAWAKLEETPARLALVVHMVRLAAGENVAELILDAASMRAGIALATWFKGEVRRAYAMMSETPEETETRKLVEWLQRQPGPVAARDVQSGCRWLRESGKAEHALNALVKAGLGEWRDVSTTEQGGRPGRVFALYPASASAKPS